MSELKPIGSGYFALICGLLFFVALVASFFVDRTTVDPYVAFQVWLVFAALILCIWGAVRVRTGNSKDYRIGQETLNFVVGVVAATFAILALINN